MLMRQMTIIARCVRSKASQNPFFSPKECKSTLIHTRQVDGKVLSYIGILDVQAHPNNTDTLQTHMNASVAQGNKDWLTTHYSCPSSYKFIIHRTSHITDRCT